jgi:hypothetical protein
MKELHLTKGFVALVDDEDYYYLSNWQWHIDEQGYAVRGNQWHGKYITHYMHREVLKARAGQIVDHINRNKLDNQKRNLRKCSHRQNMANSAARGGESVYKGVARCRGRWRAYLDGKHLGVFDSEHEAAAMRDFWTVIRYGEFGQTNFKVEKYGGW